MMHWADDSLLLFAESRWKAQQSTFISDGMINPQMGQYRANTI